MQVRASESVDARDRDQTRVVIGRERVGQTIGVADAQVAAICRDLGAALATRNTADFEETGIELIDPWKL